MSFYTKYQELGLRDQDLVSWLQFNGNVADSGPSNNNWTLVGATGTFYSANPGAGTFTFHHSVENGTADNGNFTAFLDIQKTNGNEQQMVLGSTVDGGHFSLCWAPSGAFFITVSDDNEIVTSTKFFKKLEPSKRCIIVLSKFANTFFLYLYDPFSNVLEFDRITIDYDLFYSGSGLIMGDITGNFGHDSNFLVFEMGLVKEGLPGFCVLELCKAIYDAGTKTDNFKFSWLGAKIKNETTDGELASGIINSLNVNVELPYSIAPEGFSLLGNTIVPGETRIYIDGIEGVYQSEDGYVTFANMGPTNIVVADFFDGTQSITGGASFTGAAAYVTPKGTAMVYNADGERIVDGVDYRHISSISLSNNTNFVFRSTEDLVEI